MPDNTQLLLPQDTVLCDWEWVVGVRGCFWGVGVGWWRVGWWGVWRWVVAVLYLFLVVLCLLIVVLHLLVVV